MKEAIFWLVGAGVTAFIILGYNIGFIRGAKWMKSAIDERGKEIE